MNVFSKVLVVVVAFLSCGFVVSQMLLNSRREEWRSKHDDVSGLLATQTKKAADLARESADLKQKFDNLLTRSTLEISGLREDAQDKRLQIAGLERAKEAYQQEAQGNSARIASLMDRLEQDNTKIGGLQDRNHELSAQLTGALANVENLQADVRGQKEQIKDKDGRIATLTRELRETSQDRDDLNGELARLQTLGVSVRTHPDMVPMVNGRIVRADNEFGSVVINKGRDDNVQLGVAFAIYRGTTLIAKAEVVHLEDKLCTARVDRRFLHKPVEPGDKATTELF